jgi:hypothetical protein
MQQCQKDIRHPRRRLGDRALRSAIRSGSDLDDRINDLGFRVARTVD